MSRYRIADDVAWVSHEALDAHELPSAYVTRLPHGPPTTLEGPACVVWLALAEGGSSDEIAAAAALMWGIEPDEIRGDVLALVEELVALGLATTG
ncbi:PqqD family protein [Nocardioides glacieisoli]|uniref:PqqD family protein n=1 Tax=Nocardioides glacieisoli TaxID=1168730 RepID=A0A4Q2RTK6_9ACTN|nr:PqqD family protein [Nocardioides glacieisoli]RYB92347.1 PqqD family protein [Nocardioides glacieisoli]